MKFLKPLNESDGNQSTDELKNLGSILTKMAKTNGFNDFRVSVENDHFLIEVNLEQIESFQRVFNLLDFIRKIKNDYLKGFRCDMDLWETKPIVKKGLKKSSVFTFEFYYPIPSKYKYYPTYDDEPFF